MMLRNYLLLVLMVSGLSATPTDDYDLWQAAIEGDYFKVEDALKRGASIDWKDHRGLYTKRTIIDPDEVASFLPRQELLRRLATGELKFRSGNTALFWASAFNRVGVVNLLLQHGADANAEGWWGPDIEKGGYTIDTQKSGTVGWTPLMVAAAQGYTNVMRLLLANNADVNYINEFFRTPLNVAIEEGQLDAVKLLIQHGAHVNDTTSPVYLAVRWNNPNMLNALLQAGGNPNSSNPFQNEQTNTALEQAVIQGNPTMVQDLLKFGAQVPPALSHNPLVIEARRALYQIPFQTSETPQRSNDENGGSFVRTLKRKRNDDRSLQGSVLMESNDLRKSALDRLFEGL